MKKYLLLLLMITIGAGSNANPIIPMAKISEIYTDSAGNWVIELRFADGVIDWIDSIRIETNSGSSLIIDYSLIPCGGNSLDAIALITNSNLDNSISINPSNDVIKVISYNGIYPEFDEVAIGNAPGSYLDCLQDGESIAFNECGLNNYATSGFSIDKTPTIAYCNDTTNAMGTFAGQVFDLDGNPFAEGYFFILYHPNYVSAQLDSDGIFSQRSYAIGL